MGKNEQLPFDDTMIERAGATLNDLVGHQLKHGVNNSYIDADDYVKRLCRLYAEQTLAAAFYGVAKMQTWTTEQVQKEARERRRNTAEDVTRDVAAQEVYRQHSKAAHPSNWV